MDKPMATNTLKKDTRPILVTGAAGFIGMHVCKALLARGERVIGFDAMTSYNDPKLKEKRLGLLTTDKKFSFVKGSLAQAPAFKKLVDKEKPRAIIHLAAQAGVRYSHENPQSYITANVLGSLNVFEAARVDKTPVVYASSSSIYGEREGTFKESDPTDTPVSLYAATKKDVEVIAATYNRLYGIPMTGLRFFTVYGPWMRTDLAMFKFARLLLLGKTIPLYAEGKGKRSYTHISLVVDGILRALDRIQSGHTIYNLGDERTFETKKMLTLLSKELNVVAKTQLLPHQQGDVMMTRASGAKAKRELGVSAQVPLEKGLPEFASWFLQHKDFLLGLKDMHS
ncbi:MAG: NAD-dependent epimerase/dehydratase family protein [Candidatus Adlerbacteria bacterium]|nr:NAD-dependent epimerase/dehydratase family protein [Candidatus Adlerbacteria bacterium]